MTMEEQQTGTRSMAEKAPEVMVIDGEEYLTIAAARERFNKSATTINDWIAAQLLTSYRRKRSKRPKYVKTKELEALLSNDMLPIPPRSAHNSDAESVELGE